MFLILKSTILLGMETEMKSPSIVSESLMKSPLNQMVQVFNLWNRRGGGLKFSFYVT